MTSRNLIIRNTLQIGYYLNSRGALTRSSNKANTTTDWIDISGAEELTFTTYDGFEGSFIGWVAFYSDKSESNFISFPVSYDSTSPIQSYTFDVPENAKYVRITLVYGDTLKYKLEKGIVSTDWTPAPEDSILQPESELQGTYNGVELWYDSDIMTARLENVFASNMEVTLELNEGLYFKQPISFTMKRNTRGDFNFKSPTHDDFIQGYFTKTIEGVEYVYGVDRLKASRDSSVTKVELLVNSTNIIIMDKQPDSEPEPVPEPEPEPEIVRLDIPSYVGVSDYHELLDAGKITLTINGETETSSSVITVEKNSTFTIELTNNQLNQRFDYDKINFIENKLDRWGQEYENIDRSPDVKTDDKMIFNITPENWETMLEYKTDSYLIKALPYLYFTARESESVESYPFLQIYKVDDDSLNTLAKEVNERRYKKDVGADGSVIKDYDVSGNILDLVRIPYAIQSEPNLEYINLNNEAMESQGKQILNYIQEINLGKIHCYHDTLFNIGYKNIEFNLFVPNFKPIPLDVSKVIDRTIEMKLNLDLTTGQGTLNLLIDGITFHVEQEKISKDIPFKTDNNRISLEDNVLNTKYLNPYLEIIVLNPDNTINTQELKQRKINKSSLLYAKSDNIILNSKATYNEQLEIEMLLRKGVYVNG